MEVIEVQECNNGNIDEIYTLSYVIDTERGITATDTYAKLKGDRGATLIDTDNPLAY